MDADRVLHADCCCEEERVHWLTCPIIPSYRGKLGKLEARSSLDHEGMLLSSLLPMAHPACFIPPRATSPGVAPPTVGWATCTPGTGGGQEKHWGYRWLWAPVWLWGIKLGSFRRAVSATNHEVISSPLLRSYSESLGPLPEFLGRRETEASLKGHSFFPKKTLKNMQLLLIHLLL